MKRQNARFNEDSDKLDGKHQDAFAVRVPSNVDDCNTSIIQGMYYTHDGTLNAPIIGQWGGLYVSGSGTDTGVVTQLHINHGGNTIYMRSLANAVWSAWRLIADSAYVENNFLKDSTTGDIEQDPANPSHSVILARVGLPDGQYHYVITIDYTTSGNLGQLAIPYGGASTGTTYVRSKYSGAWGPWIQIGSEDGNPKVVASATFNPSGGLNRSYNVSGVTDHGKGNWTVNFASAVPSSYPICSATPQVDNEKFGNIRSRTSTSVGIGCWQAADNSHENDPEWMDVIVTDF